jgi:hypothetical protein
MMPAEIRDRRRTLRYRHLLVRQMVQMKIVASMATVHGRGRVFIQQSSSRRVDPTLPSCCIRPLTSFTQ